MKKIAIIGAGITGIILASKLKEKFEVTIFEKARGVSGRCATRYHENFSFDHGAQCFTIRTEQFENFLKPYIQSGLVQEWQGRVLNLYNGGTSNQRIWKEKHWVFAPKMNSFCKVLSSDLNIKLNTKIQTTQRINNKWLLTTDGGDAYDDFNYLIVTCPPEQILEVVDKKYLREFPFELIGMQPCHALMVGLNKPWEQDFIAAKVIDNPIKWISINSTKPGRNKEVTSIIAHTRSLWSKKHGNDNGESNKQFLLDDLLRLLNISSNDIGYNEIHFWRYAIVKKTQKLGYFENLDDGIFASSDWAYTSRIEEVWIQADMLADRLIFLQD